MFKGSLYQSAARRCLALLVSTGAGLSVASAQGPSSADSVKPAQLFQVPTNAATANGADALFSSSLSSSEATTAETTDAAAQVAAYNLASLDKGLGFPGANAQYGRRRYGQTRYRGGNTNADGSEKYTVYAGAGFQLPVGTNSNYLSTSYGFQVGGGRNLNKHLGVNLEFAYDHFGLTGQTITNQSVVYFNDPTNTNGLGGNNHIWNFSVQPTYQIYSGQGLGAYVTGGVGFYHKVTNFTLPQQEQLCDYFYGCYSVYVNANADHYTSNAPGFDGGVGLTYKFSKFANERFYAEVRYVYINNSFRPGVTLATAATYNGYNYFPQNSNTTSYIPIKFGIRF